MCSFFYFFFFNDPATTEIYTLSLHDALPISNNAPQFSRTGGRPVFLDNGNVVVMIDDKTGFSSTAGEVDRKSTRLNSSHSQISYAVFCLKKKKKENKP